MLKSITFRPHHDAGTINDRNRKQLNEVDQYCILPLNERIKWLGVIHSDLQQHEFKNGQQFFFLLGWFRYDRSRSKNRMAKILDQRFRLALGYFQMFHIAHFWMDRWLSCFLLPLLLSIAGQEKLNWMNPDSGRDFSHSKFWLGGFWEVVLHNVLWPFDLPIKMDWRALIQTLVSRHIWKSMKIFPLCWGTFC